MLIFNSIFNIVLGILGLSIVVLVHEAGHYIAALLMGIRVETFSIGFGKRILGFKRGETEYQISLIPLGGYCRFYGEQSFKKALDEGLSVIPSKEGEFYGSPAWKRLIVTISGPLANIIFAIFILASIAWIGYMESYTVPRIILVSEYSSEGYPWPADEAGLRTGDLIVAIDGEPVKRFQDLRQKLIFQPGQEIQLTVERNGQYQQHFIIPRLDKENARALIGVTNWIDPIIAEINPSSSAAMAGFQSGDRITFINDIPIRHTTDIYYAIEDLESPSSEVEIVRNGKKIHLQWEHSNSGITFQIHRTRSEHLNFLQSLAKGSSETWNILVTSIKGLRMIFMGIQLQNAISGPIRLISDTGTIVARGFQDSFSSGILLGFQIMSLISVSLAFLNMLPIPVLDGGQILLFSIEWLWKQPLRPHVVYRYQTIGTIVVLVLAIAATTGDLLYFRNR